MLARTATSLAQSCPTGHSTLPEHCSRQRWVIEKYKYLCNCSKKYFFVWKWLNYARSLSWTISWHCTFNFTLKPPSRAPSPSPPIFMYSLTKPHLSFLFTLPPLGTYTLLLKHSPSLFTPLDAYSLPPLEAYFVRLFFTPQTATSDWHSGITVWELKRGGEGENEREEGMYRE